MGATPRPRRGHAGLAACSHEPISGPHLLCYHKYKNERYLDLCHSKECIPDMAPCDKRRGHSGQVRAKHGEPREHEVSQRKSMCPERCTVYI